MENKEFFKSLLAREVVPATGCTEVGAVALATAWAVQALASSPQDIKEIQVEIDESTYKNAFGVGIPGTDETGPMFAAAMGALSAKRVQQGLQILENPDKTAVEQAKALMSQKKIRIARVQDSKEILIRAWASDGKNESSAEIRGSHDHVVNVERNRKPHDLTPASGENHHRLTDRVKTLKYKAILDFAKQADLADLTIVREAMDMNTRFAEEARKKLPTLEIGRVMEKHVGHGITGKDLSSKAQFITAVSVEARMRGLDMPVMACAGSGNQGLVATIPVVETARAVGATDDRLLRALALSCLTTIYIKTFTGLLSPICGCGVAAAVGAGCGIVFLLGGDTPQIEAQINNMIGTMAGIICDGAKSGCALKALMAVGLAVEGAYLSLENVRIPSTDGIVGREVIDTLRNLQQIIGDGMPSMDSAIVDVMEKKQTEKPKLEG
jgi:L-cysteine desulfidase